MVPAVQRAGRGQRPRVADHAGQPRRRRLAAHRPEGVDHDGPGGRLGHLPRPHRPDGAEARRHHVLLLDMTHARASTSARCASSPASRCSTRCSSPTCSCPTTAWSARSTTAGARPHDARQRAGVDGLGLVVRPRRRDAARCGRRRRRRRGRRGRRAGRRGAVARRARPAHDRPGAERRRARARVERAQAARRRARAAGAGGRPRAARPAGAANEATRRPGSAASSPTAASRSRAAPARSSAT